MISRKIVAWLALLALTGPALAGSNLPLVIQNGQTRQLPAGTTLATQPSTAGGASVNVPVGVAPDSPIDGDCWTTASGYFCRIGGTTVNMTNANLASGSAGGVTGTLPLANGGTGATTAPDARTALGLGTASVANTGTSGSVVPLLNATNTWGGAQTFGANMSLVKDGLADDARLHLSGDAARTRMIRFQTGSLARMDVGIDSGAEGGSNAGSDFFINRYNDAGSYIARAFTLQRSSGNVGVGTASPLSKLDVATDMRISRSPAQYLYAIGDSGANWVRSYTDPAAAKNFVIDATTDASNTAASGGTVAMSLRTMGTERLKIDSAGAITVPGTINGAKVAPSCANILAYGGDNSGVSDNASAFNAAVAANGSANICVYLPAGNYKFNSTPTVTLPSGSSVASVTIQGDGADVTRLLPGTNIDGLQLNLTAAQHSFHVRNLSILAANASTTNTGIKVVQTNATLPNPAASDINGVTIRGADGYNSTFKFNIGVDLQSASNVNILGTAIVGSSGGAAYASAGTCLKLSGSASQIPVQFNIVGSQFNYCLRGLDYGAYVQGVQINTTNFVGNGTGIYQASGLTGTDQLAVSSSQFNNGTRDIHLQSAIDGVTITGNDFYLASAGTAAIEMGGYQYSITGNTFIQFAGTPGNGVVINAYSLMAGSITGNSFSGFTTGVVLASSSSNVLVDSNIYHNVTTAVSNAGTGATTLVYDAATVSVSGTTGLGTGGSVGLETGSNSRAGSIRLTAGTSGTAATGSTTLTLGMVAPARWICNLTPNDTVNAWVKPTTLTAAFASTTQVTVNWTNAATALTANGNYYIYYQCLPR